MGRLMQVAKQEGVAQVVAFIAPDNVGMRQLCEMEGFALLSRPSGIVATLQIPNSITVA